MADSTINLVYKLDGDIQEVDVFQLAPTLLALGELVQESNQELNPAGRQIGVNVKPFRQGSFIVDLTVFPQSHLQQFFDILSSHPIDQVKTLLEWIGLIAGTPVGAVQVLKFLRGRPKAIDQVGPGEFRYTAGDDRSITVSGPVHQLISNTKITNNIYRVYAEPVEKQLAVDDVKTYLEADPSSEVMVTRNDVPAFRDFISPSAQPPAEEEVVKEQTHHGVYLNPKRGAFDGDPRDWSFRRGGEIVVATIRDADFLQKCAIGEYRLNHLDLLIVDLLEKQRIKGTEVLKPAYEILRVTSYIKGPEQQSMTVSWS